MTPQEIVHELDKYIVGQGERSARRHRAAQPLAALQWRAAGQETPEETPDDRPTGVGKTEIARRWRLATRRSSGEATQFTEVARRRDVGTIVRDCRISVSRPGAGRRVAWARGQEAAEEGSRHAPPVPAAEIEETATRQNSGRSCARASSTTRRST